MSTCINARFSFPYPCSSSIRDSFGVMLPIQVYTELWFTLGNKKVHSTIYWTRNSGSFLLTIQSFWYDWYDSLNNIFDLETCLSEQVINHLYGLIKYDIWLPCNCRCVFDSLHYFSVNITIAIPNYLKPNYFVLSMAYLV